MSEITTPPVSVVDYTQQSNNCEWKLPVYVNSFNPLHFLGDLAVHLVGNSILPAHFPNHIVGTIHDLETEPLSVRNPAHGRAVISVLPPTKLDKLRRQVGVDHQAANGSLIPIYGGQCSLTLNFDLTRSIVDTPICHDVIHHIETAGIPVASRTRRLSPEHLKLARAEFEHMLEVGIIRLSSSSW
uniref:Uncharacterized protein n=1 Tax=Amphimedon queenslandica TaxID=400682 RepID=A0A1X7V3X9_AMPQE